MKTEQNAIDLAAYYTTQDGKARYINRVKNGHAVALAAVDAVAKVEWHIDHINVHLPSGQDYRHNYQKDFICLG